MLPAATTMAAAAAVLLAASTSTPGVEAALSPFGVAGVSSVGRPAAWGTVESIPRGGSTGKTNNMFLTAGKWRAHDRFGATTLTCVTEQNEIEIVKSFLAHEILDPCTRIYFVARRVNEESLVGRFHLYQKRQPVLLSHVFEISKHLLDGFISNHILLLNLLLL